MKHIIAITTIFSASVSLMGQSINGMIQDVQTDLEEATQILSEQRNTIAEEKIPMATRLRELQQSVEKLRLEANRAARLRDSSSLDLNSLEADIKARQDEVDYLNNLMVEYLSSLESRLHPAELPKYLDTLASAFSSVDDPSLTQNDKWEVLLAALQDGIDHVDENVGAAILDGQAVSDGQLLNGQVILYGPTAFFSGQGQGGMLIKGETDVPVLYALDGFQSNIDEVIGSGTGTLPVDSTLGRAMAIQQTEESLTEHIAKGGIWIFPILGFAFVATTLSIFKFIENSRMTIGKNVDIRPIIADLKAGNKDEALAKARALPTPANDLIVNGVEGSDQPKEILEEMMIENIVTLQPKLERLLPFIQVTAAVSPLLGLLGTVTGMINTFKLITIFGTGDAKQLSGGISEALITTEFGLIVAIPSLIAYAILSRQAKSTLANLEKISMSFINGLFANSK